MDNRTIEYRVDLNYALGMTFLFMVFTAVSIFVGLSADSSDSSPGFLAVPIGMYIIYAQKVLKDDSDAKWLQLSATTLGLVGAILVFIFFGDPGMAIMISGLFGFLGLYYIWANIITRQPIIQATDEKLFLNNGFLRGRNFEIPWQNIEKLSISTQNIMGGSKITYLIVNLRDSELYKQQNPGKTIAKIMAMNERTYGGHLLTAASHLEASDKEILTRLNSYIKKA